MADNVQWIRFKVGTFDGISFKRIKRARIEGVVNFRDKLTAVWFELLDLGGKVNNNGFLINDEIAFSSYEDIAIALDRTEEEVKLCIDWYIKNEMMDITDNLYLISNWTKYQNTDGLNKIRETNRLRQQRYRDKSKQTLIEMKDSNVTVTLRNALPLKDNNISSSNSLSKSLSLQDDLKDFIINVVDYLNTKLGTNYKYTTKETVSSIKARRDEKYSLETFYQVIDVKYDEWYGTDMAKHLNPTTLFRPSNFEKYANQKVLANGDTNGRDKFRSKQQLIDDEKNAMFNEIARERGYVK